ncbi:MAG: LysR substrate-binding domain-containing protein, partial [Roseiflexaceae bacterium]
AAAGLGVAIVPQLAIRGNEEIVARPLSAPVLTRQMALIQRSDRSTTVASRALFEALARDLRMEL